MATVEPIKYVAEIREALTPREMEKMRIACGANIRDNTVLELFLATGCRVSEVVGMKVEDIDPVSYTHLLHYKFFITAVVVIIIPQARRIICGACMP